MSGTSFEIIAIILLVLANGVFALSEMAIAAARKARLRQHAEEGSRQAKVALELAGDPNQFLSTVQVGITLIATLTGAYGGATLAQELGAYLNASPLVAPHGGSIAMTIVVVAISFLSLILGELVPKRIALAGPERIALAVAIPMRALSKAAGPIVWLLSKTTDWTLRLMHVRPPTEPPVTEEEIKQMIEEGTEAGAFEEAEQEMIEGVFNLGDRRVAELMRPRMNIVWIDAQESPEDFWATVSGSTYSRFPVGDGSLDQITGYVHVKDLLGLHIVGRPAEWKSVLRPLPAVPETMLALKVLEVFQQSRTHIALVVNEHGGAEGLITIHDILEAVVGDLPAPGDKPEVQATQREDGSWLVDGAMPVFEFKDLLELKELPGEESGSFTTLGGFVVSRLGRLPAAGDTFEVGNRRYEVVDMDRNRVDKVLVSEMVRPPAKGEQSAGA
ncbi:MAG: HlyC/CorC family transporter [Bryobacterales bacterium]|nr:HlyC/CorC family transporter [Bryobacterales bacterium]